METFNMVVFLWRVSLCISILTCVIGCKKKSWVFMLISFFTSLPITYYFFGAENAWKVVSVAPIILFLWSMVYFKTGKQLKNG